MRTTRGRGTDNEYGEDGERKRDLRERDTERKKGRRRSRRRRRGERQGRERTERKMEGGDERNGEMKMEGNLKGVEVYLCQHS